MPYIPPEVIIQAKKMDLLTYLKNYEPDELVKISNNTYCTRTHDSLKISNGKWMWFSQGFGGYNALDYLIKVRDLSFTEAVKSIMGCAAVFPIEDYKPVKQKPKKLLLPDKSTSTDRITGYLFGRGIDYEIITDCINRGLIFESLPYHNVVFIGKDEKGKLRYASYRAINNSRIMGDVSGSDKRYAFRIKGSDEKQVHIFESAIDALSFTTLYKLQCKNWKELNLISLAGVHSPPSNIKGSKIPVALEEYLQNNLYTELITLHLDNDLAGRKATEALKITLSDKYKVVDEPPPCGKDFNDFLCYKLGIKRQKEKQNER